ncbi:MAG: hypothetical protein JNL82_38365 [Myxococcales bacterium]|nr:hypothetical protein [Myxococcales bacterium]
MSRAGLLAAALLAGCASAATSRPACPPCQCVCKQADAATSEAPATCASAVAASCPPCQCVCTGPGGGAGSGGGGGPAASAGERAANERAADLFADASKKMNHRDGAGCLADLDEVVKLAPRYGRTSTYMRGLCEMLAGRCQQGKQRVGGYLREEMGQHPERAQQAAESMAANYCQGGDASDRDKLLGAYNNLAMAASETHTPAECGAWVATIKALIPRVKPRDADDYQVRSADKSLPTLAALCYGRAGDCGAAYRSFVGVWTADVKLTEADRRAAFESSVERCKGQKY